MFSEFHINLHEYESRINGVTKFPGDSWLTEDSCNICECTGTHLPAAWLPNRLISAGLEPVLSHTEKSFIVSYYRQFSTNNKMKIII